ncbi:nitrate ABC transporter [Klebsiella pneumoniae]|nr:nitrate ABC transporter [Klebsiella pneumoniae]
MKPLIQVQAVSQRFNTASGEFLALQNVSFDIVEGETISLIGHSGCGKSTLLNLIAGITTPTEGGLLCDNREIAGPGPERAVVFQNHSLLPWLSCFDNVALAVDQVFRRTMSKSERRGVDRTQPGARTDGSCAAQTSRGDLRRHEAAGGYRPGAGDEAESVAA